MAGSRPPLVLACRTVVTLEALANSGEPGEGRACGRGAMLRQQAPAPVRPNQVLPILVFIDDASVQRDTEWNRTVLAPERSRRARL